jgi:hypothetical protein
MNTARERAGGPNTAPFRCSKGQGPEAAAPRRTPSSPLNAPQLGGWSASSSRHLDKCIALAKPCARCPAHDATRQAFQAPHPGKGRKHVDVRSCKPDAVLGGSENSMGSPNTTFQRGYTKAETEREYGIHKSLLPPQKL